MSVEKQQDKGYERFIEKYPRYGETGAIDELRAKQYPLLDRDGHVYLDYTGSGLYAERQVREHERYLRSVVLGNPHSFNPTSSFTTDMVNDCRLSVLRFFNADPDEYIVVFTANATHALKLVGESYPFGEGDLFMLTFDNHNSVNGIREFDRARGAVTRYVPVVPPDMRTSDPVLREQFGQTCSSRHRLFAYPAQSNFSGVQHPLEWIEAAQKHGWDVVLDAAAFVPTNRLDLGRWKPDYVAVSFYKMFGHPTGTGALIARRSALEKLHRPWFAGGTITVASVQADKYFLAPGAEGFEDGTVNFTCLPAVKIGIEFLESVGIGLIHDRVMCLTGWMIENLLEMRHGNGRPVVRLYGPTDLEMRGATVTINIYDAHGEAVDHRVVEQRAMKRMISLRTGCFCNPGAGELALGLSKDEMIRCLHHPVPRMSLEEFWQCIDAKSTGAVRLSLGIASDFEDVRRLLEFVAEFRE
jgi:selenocysteine lyase/cysteine desulfurase